MSLLQRDPWMQGYTGGRLPILKPTPEHVRPLDIAHALSLVNRFGGHTLFPYSVAQHSLMVSRLVPIEFALHALLHDAAEAYIGDIISPMKQIPELKKNYLEIEDRWLLAIGERFGLGDQLTNAKLPKEVKHADLVALVVEKRDVMGPCDATIEEWFHVPPGAEGFKLPEPPPGEYAAPESWMKTKGRFLNWLLTLCEKQGLAFGPLGPL